VLLDRRFQVRGEHGRSVAQRELHEIIEHSAQKSLHCVGTRRMGRNDAVIRIVIPVRNDRRCDVLHERAQRREISARVGARCRQRELLCLVSHAPYPSACASTCTGKLSN